VEQKIIRQIKSLPKDAGIYKFYDNGNKLIYVGKAKNLKNRVSSYFSKAKFENGKTALMVSKIQDLDFTIVNTEMDALLLENSLIKEFQPRYNINLKDDKSFPLIKITNERFPRVFPIRNPIQDGSEYFGPYTSAKFMRVLLDLIKQLYPIRTCNLNLSEKNIAEAKFKVCLEYQIGNCLGPCENLQQEDNYLESIRQIKHLLKGNLIEVKKHLQSLLQKAVGDLQFEQAEEYKKRLEKLSVYQHKSTVVNERITDVDVFTFDQENVNLYMNMLSISNGMIVQSKNRKFKLSGVENEEVIGQAIIEMRGQLRSTNTRILLEKQTNWPLNKIECQVPKAGDKLKLIQIGRRNLNHFKYESVKQQEALDPELKAKRILSALKEDLNLKELPKHIECFDNSNLQGHQPISACVVFKDAKPSKKDYRYFNIKTVSGPNDFASMEEALYRRYSRLLVENSNLPQLVVIDGGKGQLSASYSALKRLNLNDKIQLIGIAKRLEEIYFPNDSIPAYLNKKSESLKLIQRLRDEAHRFGLKNHRNKRSKDFIKHELTQLPNIGEKTVSDLLKKFRSMKKVKEASEIELSNVIGSSKAKIIFYHYQQKK
tara:strand:- start:8983 stop:10779 length:1797 start_codon:yes stop_codon:yes gene_type:complete